MLSRKNLTLPFSFLRILNMTFVYLRFIIDIILAWKVQCFLSRENKRSPA